MFAPRPSATTEDDGYLILFVFNKKRNCSNFVILDAKNIANDPVTNIHLPRMGAAWAT